MVSHDRDARNSRKNCSVNLRGETGVSVPMLPLHWQAIPGILHPNCCEKNKFGGSILGGECMADATEELLSAFDGHDVEGVRAALDAGADPCSPIRGKLPVLWLLEEYTRSDRLGDCLRLLFERGAELPDPSLTPVLLNDAQPSQRQSKSTGASSKPSWRS